MDIDWNFIVVAIISGSLATIPGVWALRNQYKKDAADASASNVDTALKLKAWMEEEIAELKERCAAMEKELAEQEGNITDLRRRLRVLSNHATKLIEQIEAMDIEPVVSIAEINHTARRY